MLVKFGFGGCIIESCEVRFVLIHIGYVLNSCLYVTWKAVSCVTFNLMFLIISSIFNPYPTAFPYGNGMVLHFYQQQESSTTKTVHKVINKGLKTYV